MTAHFSGTTTVLVSPCVYLSAILYSLAPFLLDIFEATTANHLMAVADIQLGKVWSCTHCGKTSKKRWKDTFHLQLLLKDRNSLSSLVGCRSNLQHHVEVAHVAEDPGRYGCQVCSLRHSVTNAWLSWVVGKFKQFSVRHCAHST